MQSTLVAIMLSIWHFIAKWLVVGGSSVFEAMLKYKTIGLLKIAIAVLAAVLLYICAYFIVHAISYLFYRTQKSTQRVVVTCMIAAVVLLVFSCICFYANSSYDVKQNDNETYAIENSTESNEDAKTLKIDLNYHGGVQYGKT
jgi:hypothetical protein